MIHKYKKNHTHLVLDVNSGAVHVVDALVYDLLDHYPITSHRSEPHQQTCESFYAVYGRQAVLEAIEEIDFLVEQGLLCTPADDRIHEPPQRDPIVKALCLHVAHDCNLSCSYCFASEGVFQGERMLMDHHTAVAAIDFLFAHSGSRRHLEVDFFGGEPLLNFSLIQEVVAYTREKEKNTHKQTRFTVTTNGLALNENNMNWLNEHMSNVVFSLDGRPEVNDAMRCTCNGEGSYQHVYPRIHEMVSKRKEKPYFIRGTFTRMNLDFLQDVKHLVEHGFNEISIEPVVAPPDKEFSLRRKDVETICRQYDELALYYLDQKRQGRSFRFFHFLIDLQQGPCIRKRSSGCGAGTEYVAVTPDGALYPCHQFVGNKRFQMGDVVSGISGNSPLLQQFKESSIHHKHACRQCWAKFYCSGGCHANAWHANAHLHEPYEIGCLLEKARIENALMIKARESEESFHDSIHSKQNT